MSEKDNEMYRVLHQHYYSFAHKLRRLITLKTLGKVNFVRFHLYYGTYLDIDPRDRNEIPPDDSPDYDYHPKPMDCMPPILLSALMHFIETPGCALDVCNDLNRMPKKTNTMLVLPPTSRKLEGWGLHFQERLCWVKIALAEMLIGLFAFVFAIGWCKARKEASIQDGFSISAGILAFGNIILGLVQGVAWAS